MESSVPPGVHWEAWEHPDGGRIDRFVWPESITELRALEAVLFVRNYRSIDVPLASAFSMTDLVTYLESIGEIK